MSPIYRRTQKNFIDFSEEVKEYQSTRISSIKCSICLVWSVVVLMRKIIKIELDKGTFLRNRKIHFKDVLTIKPGYMLVLSKFSDDHQRDKIRTTISEIFTLKHSLIEVL